MKLTSERLAQNDFISFFGFLQKLRSVAFRILERDESEFSPRPSLHGEFSARQTGKVSASEFRRRVAAEETDDVPPERDLPEPPISTYCSPTAFGPLLSLGASSVRHSVHVHRTDIVSCYTNEGRGKRENAKLKFAVGGEFSLHKISIQ